MSVYDENAFAARVALAASYISAGRESTRAFDTCFEMNDGDAVALALYRRAAKAPNGPLARNIWGYLGQASVEALATRYADESDLADLAARIRREEKAKREAMWAKMREDQAARNREIEAQRYATELTPAGEQTVIPGCELNASPKARQLSLFG